MRDARFGIDAAKRVQCALTLVVVLATPVGGTHAAPAPHASVATYAVRVGRYQLRSNSWVNLHQRLYYEARFDDAPPVALAGADLAAWKRAVDAYRAYVGKRDSLFDDELIALNETLAKASRFELPPGVPAAAAAALEAAAPLYRKAPWAEDDRANRFWIAVAVPLLRSAADDLAAAHAKVYGVPFPTHVDVDVAACAGEFGAYTVGEGDRAHVTIASLVVGNQGFASLEMLMHEPSHAIVGDTSHAIGSDLVRLGKELGVRPPPALWHAILFYTSSELTRRALGERGVTDYKPVTLGMYNHGFARYRKALEVDWQAYLDLKTTREAAIRQMLIDTTTPAK